MSKLDILGKWKNPGKVFITGASSGIGASYAKAFAFSFVFRPMMKIVSLGSCAIIAVVLLLYALKALACVVKVLAGQD